MAANIVSFGSVREKDMLAFSNMAEMVAVGIRCPKPRREEAKRRFKLEMF
jgi:hypothetical protein